MISQHTTYFKNYSIKTYTELSEGLEVVFKRYDMKGRLIYIRYGTGEWERWKYNPMGYQLLHKKHTGEYIKRRFNDKGRMVYEETELGVNYDWTLKR